jgi:hypothetical protein
MTKQQFVSFFKKPITILSILFVVSVSAVLIVNDYSNISKITDTYYQAGLDTGRSEGFLNAKSYQQNRVRDEINQQIFEQIKQYGALGFKIYGDGNGDGTTTEGEVKTLILKCINCNDTATTTN